MLIQVVLSILRYHHGETFAFPHLIYIIPVSQGILNLEDQHGAGWGSS